LIKITNSSATQNTTAGNRNIMKYSTCRGGINEYRLMSLNNEFSNYAT